jgi:hypothetical protein
LKELIKKKVLAKSWTFNEISDLTVTIKVLSEEVWSEMTLLERIDLVRDIRINENMLGHTFEDEFRDIGIIQIQANVAEVIKQMLNTATVNFGGNNNEVSENGLGGESSKKRTANEKKKDDNKE